jgi:hypothetical protein
MQRIAVLCDDQWVSMLLKLDNDVTRRITTLEKEAIRVNQNNSLSLRDKQVPAMMDPVLYDSGYSVVDKINESFQPIMNDSFDRRLDNIQVEQFEAFGRDESSHGEAQEVIRVWQPLKDLLQELQTSVGRRERLELAKIA